MSMHVGLGLELGAGLVVLGRGLGDVVVGLALGEVALTVGEAVDRVLAWVESGVRIGVPLPCGPPLRLGSALVPRVSAGVREGVPRTEPPTMSGESDGLVDAAVPAETGGTRDAPGIGGSTMTTMMTPAKAAAATISTAARSFLVNRDIPAFQPPCRSLRRAIIARTCPFVGILVDSCWRLPAA
jgi:hypothetical protein